MWSLLCLIYQCVMTETLNFCATEQSINQTMVRHVTCDVTCTCDWSANITALELKHNTSQAARHIGRPENNTAFRILNAYIMTAARRICCSGAHTYHVDIGGRDSILNSPRVDFNWHCGIWRGVKLMRAGDHLSPARRFYSTHWILSERYDGYDVTAKGNDVFINYVNWGPWIYL